jgi:hypothetical protein
MLRFTRKNTTNNYGLVKSFVSSVSIPTWSRSSRVLASSSSSSSSSSFLVSTTRHWSAVPPVSETAKAFEEQELQQEAAGVDSLLRCIEKERDDEALRLDKHPPKMPPEWIVDHIEGTSYFTMKRIWNDEIHEIRAYLTQRNPALDPESDLRGEHFPFTLTVEKQDSTAANRAKEYEKKTIDFSLDVVEGECVVDKVRVYGSSWLAKEHSPRGHFERNTLFPGPNLDEAEEEVLDGFQLYLAERQVDDQLAEFIGQYSVWIEQLEYERWLKHFHNFVSA